MSRPARRAGRPASPWPTWRWPMPPSLTWPTPRSNTSSVSSRCWPPISPPPSTGGSGSSARTWTGGVRDVGLLHDGAVVVALLRPVTASGADRVRVAAAMTELPQTSREFEAGRLSYSQVRAICRVADEGTEGLFVGIARHASAEQLERIVSGYRRARRVDPDPSPDDRDRRGLAQGPRSRSSGGGTPTARSWSWADSPPTTESCCSRRSARSTTRPPPRSTRLRHRRAPPRDMRRRPSDEG